MTERRSGDLVEELEVGRVKVQVKHSCVKRDMFDLRVVGSLPSALREKLEREGSVRGSDELYVVDVAGRHSITAAPAAGRIVIMPRMVPDRPAQRRAALAVARVVDETCEA